MNDFVRTLDSVSLSDAPLVGSKAAVLGTLRAAGFPVPSGLCITTAAFELALLPFHARIQEIFARTDLHRLEAAQEAEAQVLALLRPAVIPRPLAVALEKELAQTPGQFFAVRSSSTAEDLEGASFAGQYATLLGVPTRSTLDEAILACWRSFFSANATVARAEAGLSPVSASMAVLIQPMVNAECAGVCFSVDPVHRQSDLLIIDATWGLGVGAVDGSLSTDTVRVRRDDLTVEGEQIADKPEQFVLLEGGGVQRAPVNPALRRIPCLPTKWAQGIAAFGLAAEQLLGRPQDVEWAVADGQIWILQSRPITGLAPELAAGRAFPVSWDSKAEARAYWTLSVNSRQAIPLPLEHDYHFNYRMGWEEGEHVTGGDSPTRYKVVNGRRYWAKAPSDLSAGDSRVRMRAVTELNDRLLQDGGKTAWYLWGPEVVAATDRLSSFKLDQADGAAFADHLEDVFAVARRDWMVHNLLGLPPLGRYLAAYRAINGHDSQVENGPEFMERAARLTEGEDTIFTRLIDWLYRLACRARQVALLEQLILCRPLDVLDQLATLQETADFWTDLQDFLDIYGVRTGAGLGSDTSLRTPTWREQPELVLRLIAAYLDTSVEDPALSRARARQGRDAEVDALCAACDDPALVSEFRRQLTYVREDATLLEEHNHYIDQMATGQTRQAILAVGRWLAEQGLLAYSDDIFWMHLEEIFAVLRGESKVPCQQIVAAHQAEYQQWEQLQAPANLGVPPAKLSARPPAEHSAAEQQAGNARHLVGKAASPGRGVGRARVVPMGTLVPEVVRGDVLVAENAGPLWTPIFPILNGIVLDEGAVLGHASTMAREYGIPAVVGTHNATQLIADGAWVTIDGTEGFVEIAAAQDA